MAASDDFERWYRAAWPSIVRALVAAGVERPLAEDAAAEAFARALARWPRVALVDSPAGWVFRVATNVVRRHHRRAALERRLLGRGAATLVAPPGVPADVWEAVATLPERQRLAVVLRYVLDLPQHEVAAWMGVAPGTAAATLAQARRRLGHLVSEEEERV